MPGNVSSSHYLLVISVLWVCGPVFVYEGTWRVFLHVGFLNTPRNERLGSIRGWKCFVSEGCPENSGEWYMGAAWAVGECQEYFWWRWGENVKRRYDLWSLLGFARGVLWSLNVPFQRKHVSDVIRLTVYVLLSFPQYGRLLNCIVNHPSCEVCPCAHIDGINAKMCIWLCDGISGIE